MQRLTGANRRAPALALLILSAGCAHNVRTEGFVDRSLLTEQAVYCLKRAIQYEQNPVVRVAAIEALEAGRCAEALPWIRAALGDQHPAVRFAACVATGMLKDETAETLLRNRVADGDDSVEVAALFALHRIGSTEHSERMPPYLLDNDDVAVRRNAAFVLGRLDEPGVVKLLARAMKDRDTGVRNHALEAMSRLGNPESRQQLVFLANSGLGSDEVFALNALAQLRDPVYYDLFLYKLDSAGHLETKLAAIRGLGLLGGDEGYDLALRSVRFNRPVMRDSQDTPADQVLRTRQLAASALGAIGNRGALPVLEKVLMSNEDARLQVSAARAILEILSKGGASEELFPPVGGGGGDGR